MCLFECFTPLSSVCLLQGGEASLYSKIRRLLKNVSDERIKKQARNIVQKWEALTPSTVEAPTSNANQPMKQPKPNPGVIEQMAKNERKKRGKKKDQSLSPPARSPPEQGTPDESRQWQASSSSAQSFRAGTPGEPKPQVPRVVNRSLQVPGDAMANRDVGGSGRKRGEVERGGGGEKAQNSKRKAEETFGGAAEDGSGVSGEHAVKRARAADDTDD